MQVSVFKVPHRLGRQKNMKKIYIFEELKNETMLSKIKFKITAQFKVQPCVVSVSVKCAGN